MADVRRLGAVAIAAGIELPQSSAPCEPKEEDGQKARREDATRVVSGHAA